LVVVPVELDSFGLQDVAPALEVQRFGIGQDPVEVEEQRRQFRVFQFV